MFFSFWGLFFSLIFLDHSLLSGYWLCLPFSLTHCHLKFRSPLEWVLNYVPMLGLLIIFHAKTVYFFFLKCRWCLTLDLWTSGKFMWTLYQSWCTMLFLFIQFQSIHRYFLQLCIWFGCCHGFLLSLESFLKFWCTSFSLYMCFCKL